MRRTRGDPEGSRKILRKGNRRTAAPRAKPEPRRRAIRRDRARRILGILRERRRIPRILRKRRVTPAQARRKRPHMAAPRPRRPRRTSPLKTEAGACFPVKLAHALPARRPPVRAPRVVPARGRVPAVSYTPLTL